MVTPHLFIFVYRDRTQSTDLYSLSLRWVWAYISYTGVARRMATAGNGEGPGQKPEPRCPHSRAASTHAQKSFFELFPRQIRN